MNVGGLSPRVRGNRRRERSHRGSQRSIPACAGGTTFLNVSVISQEGLSPRVRGNRSASVWSASQYGSIPACAGEPSAGAGSSGYS